MCGGGVARGVLREGNERNTVATGFGHPGVLASQDSIHGAFYGRGERSPER
jgi:hypothetical protein